MKSKIFTKLFFVFLMVSGTVLFSACSDDDDATPLTSTNSATATIGTTAFTSVKMNASTESFMGVTVINLDYINQAGDTIKLGIYDLTPVGEPAKYDMSQNGGNGIEIQADFLINYVKADGTEYMPSDGGLANPSNGDKGTLTITAHDKSAKVIKGTFSGGLTYYDFDTDARERVTITNGNFEAKY
ncbi:hypothetical protein ACFSC6_16550 [Rufibacter sediminis]|uniref:Uncharacterized protein n=1 Tax=Rufibacter sediminis TaxID=2762756 RepID=A0ABR6VNB5_9BACT|nr:hypothetical protein [Rufibacter sediminis]MBC3538402.1 hypothetical protein [Rufibacter sediminis]